jgi:hypothetical protein
MKAKVKTISSLLVISITLLLLNLAIIPNLQYASAAELSREDMTPEKDQFWKKKNKDLENGWVFEFTLEVIGESVTKVANRDISVLVLEGTGKIVKWADDISQAQRTDQNKIYMRREINKENLEKVTETLNISYEYYDDENRYFENYIDIFTTYDIKELTKPDNITVGSNWTKRVIKTELVRRKFGAEEEQIIQQPEEEINSTIECDRIEKVTVPAGEFDTFRIVEQQFIQSAFPDTTIFWYFSIAAKNFVKIERWNAESIVAENEEVLKFGEKDNDPPPPNGNNDTNGESGWLDLGDRNVQLLLSLVGIIIICLIIGAIMYKRGKGQTKSKSD